MKERPPAPERREGLLKGPRSVSPSAAARRASSPRRPPARAGQTRATRRVGPGARSGRRDAESCLDPRLCRSARCSVPSAAVGESGPFSSFSFTRSAWRRPVSRGPRQSRREPPRAPAAAPLPRARARQDLEEWPPGAGARGARQPLARRGGGMDRSALCFGGFCLPPQAVRRYFIRSWSSQFDLEIDRRLEKKLKITQKERKSKSPPKVPIVIQDDSLPTGPPPQIRILKRPTSNGVVSGPNSASRPALPVKSLAQREAEYAEARKRILGSASPEEEQEKPILDRPTRISQPEDSRQPNNVIRQPLGPDGSQGFKQRR
ncbi:SUZ domain-containing protein 1 [Moschus berezovskii]|uniref:SUZ domain-containing protein 1 n=1 Tax=Moschus berezovskii TaxID=68408 RepID=UPI00244430C9|nr:SUZ domain-containing protein 1 [Moschus berezovskii]